jgi:nitrite reductase/ring-hydroxylating ferredoxin subunit
MASFVKVCTRNDIPAGSGKTVDVNGTAVALFNVDGTFYAINDTCIHRGGPLGEGELQGKIAICPWHGWRWDVTNGVNQLNPAVSVKTYEVKLEGDDVLVGA